MASAEYQKQWKAAHPEKAREYHRRWREKIGDEAAKKQSRERAARERALHPERVRERKKKNYDPAYELSRSRQRQGLPEPTRPIPLFCECGCGRLAEVLEHDHETGKFRGWLSSECNLGLGKLGDSIEGVERILAYLKRAL
jgi:hypothetical protein